MFYENYLTSDLFSRRVCLLVKMASKTVIRPIAPDWLRKWSVQFALSVWKTEDHVAGKCIDMRHKTSAQSCYCDTLSEVQQWQRTKFPRRNSCSTA